jgi:iron complex outermembrane recepter protein
VLKIRLSTCWMLLTAVVAPLAQAANVTAIYEFNLPPQPLGDALKSVGQQATTNVLFDPRTVANTRAPALHGTLTTKQAIDQLLSGTELIARQTSADTVLVQSRQSVARSSEESGGASRGQEPAKEGETGSSNEFRMAQVDQGAPSSVDAVGGDSATSKPSLTQPVILDEVVVTAQKRSERLQDVPVPVTAISADSLVESNQTRLQDFYTSVPGLTVTPAATQGYQLLSIRGITTGGGTNPTVGITVDDVPYGASTNLGGGLIVPDIDPNDLARVEVLRGPQGTLYGANSMGGLLKFVTVDPSTEGQYGSVQTGLSGVSNGAEVGYNVRGSVNYTLSDTLAVRASGFTRQDPGYIDNPFLHINGINEDHVSGGRLSTLWRPSDAFSLKLSALYQQTQADGSNDVDRSLPGFGLPPLGDLQQDYLRGVGGHDRKVQAYSAVLSAKLGVFDLTSVSGYNVNQYNDSWDLSYLYGPFTQPLFQVTGTPVTDQDSTRKFTQEVRLSAHIGPLVDWLLGAFYTHESSQVLESIIAENPTTGQDVGTLETLMFPTSYQEYAAFTDVTFHLTDQFDVQIGGRETQIRQTFSQTNTGPYATPNVPEVATNANAFTYLVTPRFKVSPGVMLYARLASGFRAGGANTSPGSYAGGIVVSPQYNPDKTNNYEIGAKGDFLDHTLSMDASLYYIDWNNIQLQSFNAASGQSYNFNASRAKSEGVELSLEARPLRGLTIGAWVVWDDAALTQDFPAISSAYGVSGDRLPYGSRFSGNVSIEDDFPLWSAATGFVGAAGSYVGDREGVFTPSAATPRQTYPAYAKLDLRAGIRLDTWTAELYANNVADRRGELSGGTGQFPPFAFTYIQPRTVGLSLTKKF